MDSSTRAALVLPWRTCMLGRFTVLLLLLVLASFPGEEKVPRITISGDKSAGPADGPKADVMQELLNWGIKHSDPERLKELMQKYQDQNLTIKDVYGQDMIDALFVNEGSVMQDMIAQIMDFENSSITDDDLTGALERLQELVEQVDNAGNLHGMSGLKPLLDLGTADHVVGKGTTRSESVRALALWTLGVAVQNNPPVQDDLLSLRGLPVLLDRLSICKGGTVRAHGQNAGDEYCGKLLFAISGFVRNNETILASADDLGLFDWLIDYGIQHHALAIAKKAMGLLDIALSQRPDLAFLGNLSAKQDVVADCLLDHIRGEASVSDRGELGVGRFPDSDGAEKALRLINRLISSRPMLFRSSFKSELSDAAKVASRNCENLHGSGDELCDGLGGIAQIADLALAARELSDEEL